VTQTASAHPLGLRLVVSAPGKRPLDVELQAAADSTVGGVVEALAHELGLDVDGRLAAVRARSGTRLDLGATLAASGLSHGDELVVGREGELPPADGTVGPGLELAVAGGPEAGRRFPLARGEHSLGRVAEISLDDPALSGEHLRLAVDAGGAVTVADCGSRNGTAVEGVALAAGEPRTLRPGELVQAGRTLLELEPALEPAPAAAVDRDGSIPFNRPPRVNRPLRRAERPFEAPPGDPHRTRVPLGASLVPLALGLGLYAFTHLPTMLFFAALTPVMAVSTVVEDRRSGKRGFARQARRYRERLVELDAELQAERGSEVAARRAAAPSAAELVRRAVARLPSLWERRGTDADFASLRVGSADLPAFLSVGVQPGGNEALRAEAEELAGWYATAPAVPVALPLAELGAVGLCGDAAAVAALGRWLVAQAAALHSPRELVVAAAVAEDARAGWDWLKWLPHTRSETSPLSVGLTTGVDGARSLLEDLGRVLRERRDAAEGTYGGAAQRPLPFVLALVDEAVAPERPLVAEVLRGAASGGAGVVWLGRERRDLPGECTGLVELDPATPRLALTDARSGEALADVTADGLPLDVARELALALAPVRDTSALRGGAVLPDRVGLLELLETEAVTPEWVAGRWRRASDAVAVIGGGAGAPFSVDLRRDGPHGLVAGTTGAGKSELLQTLIASLAVTLPPTRLTFLLVDYKGGAAFKECVALPHTVGFVTDLDGHLAQRALVSLNAELRRRERMLRDAGAKDLPDLERRAAERAPASLVIVIDEFATLAKEVPEFVDGVVDVAQRGRSLGVHLVLATQRPGGVVSDNIRANTNLRIALRVSDANESSDVIGAPDAARIPRGRPGRAFARTGHEELTELQTAYVGGVSVRAAAAEGIVVRRLGFEWGREQARAEAEGAGETDLQRLVAAAAAAARAEALPAQPSPWLPPLEPVVPLESLPEPDGDLTGTAIVGLLDEPAHQRQQPFAVDLESEGSVLVYGATGSGKTTFLRTLAASLARRASDEELHVYGLDFATRGLQALEALPHTGSVIAGEDEERTARLFSMLRTAMEKRKVLFAQHGVFTLSEYRRARGGEPLSRILVLLDNYAGFTAAFERVNLGELVDALPRLVGDGRPLGVHFAISADRRGAVPNALAGIIPAKVVLRMADEDEYAALGIPLRTVRGAQLPAGRGFLPGGLELQVALLGDDPSGEGQATAVAALGAELRSRSTSPAPPIEPLPTRVERSSLPAAKGRLSAPLGLGDAELEPVHVDLSERHFLVCGPYRSGRSTALRTLCESLRGLDLVLLAPRRSPLVDLALWREAARGTEACDELAAQLAPEVEARRGDAGHEPLVLVIDDGEELAETLGGTALETIVRRGRDLDVRVVAACERQAAQRAFTGWLRELRKEEHGLLLDPDPDVDGDLLGVRLPRRSSPVFPAGRGYLVRRGAAELVQVALP
jgi:DNA segregation ATPase FtsK/SpoIIIE, S-DNA-T family